MFLHRVNKPLGIAALLAGPVLLVGGCPVQQTNNDGDGTNNAITCNNPTDFSDTWDLRFTNISSSCGPEPDDDFVVTITQNACAITMTGIKDSNQAVTGTVDGNTATFPNTDFSEDGGTTTGAFTFEINGDQITGMETWSFRDATSTCTNGMTTITATRQAAPN